MLKDLKKAIVSKGGHISAIFNRKWSFSNIFFQIIIENIWRKLGEKCQGFQFLVFFQVQKFKLAIFDPIMPTFVTFPHINIRKLFSTNCNILISFYPNVTILKSNHENSLENLLQFRELLEWFHHNFSKLHSDVIILYSNHSIDPMKLHELFYDDTSKYFRVIASKKFTDRWTNRQTDVRWQCKLTPHILVN